MSENVGLMSNSADGRPQKVHKTSMSVNRSKTVGEQSASEEARMEKPEWLADEDTDGQCWARPALPFLDSSKDSVSFQLVDIDMYQGSALRANPKKGEALPGNKVKPVPIIRIYGVTDLGNSVMAHVHGFTPYFYVQAPPGFREENCGEFRASLDAKVRERARGAPLPNYVLAVQIETKQTILGFHGNTMSKFLKIYVSLPNLVPTARGIMQHGFSFGPGRDCRNYQCYEANMPFLLRFMIDCNIVGCNWIELPKASYAIRRQSAHVSTAQAEFDVCFNSLISHKAEGDWMKIAPMRVLSFDIECMGRKNHFPEPEKDPVIQIANIVTVQGEKKSMVRNVFTLKGCLPIAGVEVFTHDTEEELLKNWAKFIVAVDFDVITGYNINNFDIPYLLNRAKTLRIDSQFWQWGRILGRKCRMKETTFQSSAHGRRDSIQTEIDGRVVFDMITYMRRNHKLSSYSLNNVSAHFLEQQKEDVHHSIISDLQRGSDADRRRLAVYCVKDAFLPQRLMDKLMVLVNYVEMARVTGVPLSFLLQRGQQIKVLSMLYRKARTENMLIPTLQRKGSTGNDVGYEGATVIEPKRAFYDTPIATLDFASLYPSIMMAHNLCYSTLVAKSDVCKLKEDEYEVTPTGDVFVRKNVKKGILPTILEELLSARAQAKKDMKAAKDPMIRAVQNGRQLALKISANSVYGFTGATVGQLPCLPISSSVTSFGRRMIEMTKEKVEEVYTVKNGYPADAEVVYGDTDSVMIRFGVPTVKEAMDIGYKAADVCSALFPNPVKLEFEKVYFPYLLMNKKRYAGLYWTNPDKPDKLDSKGIETVRRDNSGLVRNVVGKVLQKIIVDRDVDSAIQYTKHMISQLLQNKVDISLLVITKSLSKPIDSDDYKSKQAHVELARRMAQRDRATAPVVGDRVPYVITQKEKGAAAYEKSEDPLYVLENDIPIDTRYYLDNQLRKPLERIFEPIIGDRVSSLFAGEHTRSIVKATPKARAGGIMMFAVKKEKCLGCKAVLPAKWAKTHGHFCKHCKGDAGREARVFTEKLARVHDLETRFSRLWTQCQGCQGSLHHDVLCSNKDCPIFYMRKKVQKDLNAAHESLDKFGTPRAYIGPGDW
eukprot:g4067.t1